ncbi:MAG: C40 family peptidase [Mariniphaga sp.]|nr:C40 family peptidase [Mariniphaga sp.]
MRIKISFIILLLLISFSSQSKSKAPNLESDETTSTFAGIKRADLIRFAKKLLGTPYHFASSSPKKGFDCSGFVKYVFSNYKINLPRSSKSYEAVGKSLKPAEFKVGDVIVFYGFKDKTRIGHVGIICEADGMNSKFIHSSSGKSKGVTISDLGSNMYTRRFYKCIDVIN